MKKKVSILIIIVLLAIGGLGYKIYLDYNELNEKTKRIEDLGKIIKEKEEAIAELDENIAELKEGSDGKVFLRDELSGAYLLDRGNGAQDILFISDNGCMFGLMTSNRMENIAGSCQITDNSIEFRGDGGTPQLHFRVISNNEIELVEANVGPNEITLPLATGRSFNRVAGFIR